MKIDYKKATLGILIFLPVLILFLLDRIILFFLFWQSSPKVSEFFKELHLIKMAIYRVGALLFLWLFYQIIKYF